MFNFLHNLPGLTYVGGAYVLVRALITAADVLLVLLFLYALRKAWRYRTHFSMGTGSPQKKTSSLRTAYFKDRWAKLIKKYTEIPTPDSMRLAIIEADALVDNLLKDMNFPGDHLADRLSYLNNQEIKSLDGLWQAHRLRNDVVHHPSTAVSIKQGMAALSKYESFFKELEVI